MADQEFLASFGVEIDESGVSRLQSVLEENRDLANEVAAAFEAATEAIREYEKAASGDNPSGEGNRNDGTRSPSGNAGSAEGSRDTGTAGNRDTGVAGTEKDGFWISDNPMQNLVRQQLGGVLTGNDAPAMPATARELTLANLETMYLGQASRDSGNARKELISWQEIGLSSNPASIDGYDELVSAAQDLLREPMEKAREYMKQAMDAEDAGEDGSEYVRMVDEVLRKPLEQVKELVDNFDFGDESGGNAVGDEDTESELDLDTTAADESLEVFREKASEPVSMELDVSDSLGEGNDQSGTLNMDLTEAKANLESFRKDASKPVSLSGNASGIVSAARSAFSSVKSIFSTPVTLKVNVEKTVTTQTPEDTSLIPMSTGGRFTKPTDVQVAEDGDAEYIIPIKKEDRALPLLKQLISELSPQARASLVPEEETEEDTPEIDLQALAANQPVPQVQDGLAPEEETEEAEPEINLQALAANQPLPQVREVIPEVKQTVSLEPVLDAVPEEKQAISLEPVRETVRKEKQNVSANPVREALGVQAAQPLPAVRETVPEEQQNVSSTHVREILGEQATQPLAAASGVQEQAACSDASGLLSKLGDVLSASLHETTTMVTQNTSQNVSAPVNIQVHASSANAERIGESIYDATERYLVRTLQGVMA